MAAQRACLQMPLPTLLLTARVGTATLFVRRRAVTIRHCPSLKTQAPQAAQRLEDVF